MELIHRNDVDVSVLRNKMPDGCRAVDMLHLVQDAALIMADIKKVASVTLADRIDRFQERVDRCVPNIMNQGCSVINKKEKDNE